MSAYSDVMKTRLEDVKDPEPLPSGEWEFRCNSAKIKENEDYDPEASNSYVASINVGVVPVQPVGHTPETDEWRGQTVFKRIYVRGAADLLDIRRMTEAMGLSYEGRDIEDVLPLMKDQRFIAAVGLRSFTRRDGTSGKDNTLSGYRPVE